MRSNKTYDDDNDNDEHNNNNIVHNDDDLCWIPSKTKHPVSFVA